jgi:transcriptional regulator with XRE-family HTH domain
MSQLALATVAEVSQRHISFLETGRVSPSREMVVHLATALDLPPREHNVLLLSAGLAPRYPETPLDRLDDISEIVDFVLDAHEPFMAIAVDRLWNVVRSNRPATDFMQLFFDHAPAFEPPLNLMRLAFHPDGLRRHTENWEASAASLRRRLRRDAALFLDDRAMTELCDEIDGYPGVDGLDATPESHASDLLVPTTYLTPAGPITLISSIATLGAIHDVTAAELRLETFFPADDRSRARWMDLLGSD